MKFAHMSDCHLGGWRDPVISEISSQCFETAIDICLKEGVEFILISGDLFDTSRPAIEVMERAVSKIKEATEQGIRVYVIEGSHDFSPTGKTMLRVLEKAGLFTRVSKGTRTAEDKLRLKFTIDMETGTKITGLVGRKGILETRLYENLDRETLLNEEGFKIFMFHSGLDELKPKLYEHAQTMPISLLPQGFDYYAGGHIHKHSEEDWKGYGKIVFPGPTMPANFRELEKLGHGGFYLISEESGELKTKWKELELYQLFRIHVDADGKTPESVENEIQKQIDEADLEDKIVLLRIEGTLRSGRSSDINFRRLMTVIREKDAQLVKKNISKLTTQEYEETQITSSSREDLEDRLIKEHAGQKDIGEFKKEEQIQLTKDLMNVLAEEKNPDETNKDYNSRIGSNVLSVLGIKKKWEELI